MDLLYRLFKSIEKNTKAEDYELVYVDNGSPAAPLRHIQNKWPQHTYVHLPFNHGSVRAINIGLALAELSDAEFILLMDNDTEIPEGDKDWLDRWLGYFNDPKVGMAAATSNYVSGYQQIESVPDLYQKDWAVEGEGAGQKDPYNLPLLVSFAMMLRKSAVERIGVFDELFEPGNFEDHDYSLRMHLQNWKTIIATSVYIHHKGSQTFGSMGFSELLKTNQEKFVQKYGKAQLKQWGIVFE